MQEVQKILKRNEVQTEMTWDLSDLFKDFKHWITEFENLPKDENLQNTIEKNFKNKLANSPKTIYECLQFRDSLFLSLENLYTYASLKNSENVADNESNEALGKIENKISSISAKFAFLEPELLTINELPEWLYIAPLNEYKFSLQELIRGKPHILSEKEESLISKLALPLGIFSEIHSKWENADLKFPNAIDSQGKAHIVSNSRYLVNLESNDRTLRKNSYESYFNEVGKWRNTITANYYGNMLKGSLLAKIRKHKGYLEGELFKDNIPLNLYTGLIDSVKKNLPLLHKSMELRKKTLKVETLFPYDRYVSLYQNKNPIRFTWEEGRDLVLKAIAPLGEEYVQIAKSGLTKERWIDRAENEGKASGAFSSGTYTSRPYILQTWNGTMSNVFTLAHELGHSMHSYYTNKNQPYQYANYTIFVAEVASTLNEALLSDYILTHMQNTDLAKEVISNNIENFEGTVLRQVLFAAFEKEIADIADKEESFTPEKIEDIYLNLNKEWYGKELENPDQVKFSWMVVPHFYFAFYVYKYATSYCASLAISEKLKIDPQKTKESIFKMLKAGGSKPPLEILMDAGIDFFTGEPIDNAFANYKRNIEMAEKTFL